MAVAGTLPGLSPLGSALPRSVEDVNSGLLRGAKCVSGPGGPKARAAHQRPQAGQHQRRADLALARLISAWAVLICLAPARAGAKLGQPLRTGGALDSAAEGWGRQAGPVRALPAWARAPHRAAHVRTLRPPPQRTAGWPRGGVVFRFPGSAAINERVPCTGPCGHGLSSRCAALPQTPRIAAHAPCGDDAAFPTVSCPSAGEMRACPRKTGPPDTYLTGSYLVLKLDRLAAAERH